MTQRASETIRTEIEYLLKITTDMYNAEEKLNLRKGSYGMGSRIGKMSVLGEMQNRLTGILHRHPEATV